MGNDRDFMDLGRFLDEVFAAAEDFSEYVRDEMGPNSRWAPRFTHGRDFYPNYNYPPANVYLTESKELVIEFAIAGFSEEDVSVRFKGDYMIFSAKVPRDAKERESVRYFKHRLKLKDVHDQRYFVPSDKFNQEAVRAVLKNGVLRITVPPRGEPDEPGGFSVNIHREDDATEESVQTDAGDE